jgi:hypothetical protein
MRNKFSYCFHVETETLNDREYYYKILEMKWFNLELK